VCAAVASPAVSAGVPLRRNLDDYVIFGLRDVGLKNMTLNGACNVGVSCPQPTGSSGCGVITHENPLYGEGSQIVGDVARFSRGGGIIHQLFSNKPNGLENVFINEPPIGSPNPLPLLGDVDGDGAPSCRVQGAQCVVDAGDLAAACGFQTPFPACSPGQKVTAVPNADCQGAPDTAAGNGRCDLPPGTYGDLEVQNDAKLTLTGGTYNVCAFQFGRDTETIAGAPTSVNVHGDVAINGGSLFGPPVGTKCGQIKVNVMGPGGFAFGRNNTINGSFCAPERTVRLGHNNNLSGRFYGDEVSADSNNRAFCCDEECVESPPSTDRALRRTLDAYFILAMQRAALKNLSLGTACNIGVNCGAKNANRNECGVLSTGSLTMVDYSQVAGDQSFYRKAGGRVWQSFRNNDSPLDNVQLVAPPPNPETFEPPILPGTCDDTCTPSVPAMKAACGFPSPFPSCDAARSVRAQRNQDCPPYDTTPGNQQCDLPPGTYGSFSIQNGGWTNFSAGDYVFCRFRTGRRSKATGTNTTILVPAGGAFRASNGTELGEGCGDFRVLIDGQASSVAFGRGGLVAAKLCAPETKVALGHSNVLIGQFVANSLSADLNNVGRCCGSCP
jgi:hypothetical protein